MSVGGRRLARLLAIAALGTAVGFLLFGYKYLDLIARGYRTRWIVPFVEELTAAYAAMILLFGGVVRVARRFEPARGNLSRTLPVHAVAVLLFSGLHTSLNWASRSVIFALRGGHYDYGRMPARFAMELPMDFIVYGVFALGWVLLERQRRARQRELDAARLERRALEAELRNLRGQLEPHFLFNALNTISSIMYDDPARADEMIGHLSELMRSSLKSADARELPLSAELEIVEHYVALLKARFGDRLLLSIEAGAATHDALVPPVILQPLLENAMRHGNAALGRAATIVVRCRRLADELEIVVRDNGPGVGIDTEVFARGVGLTGTRERLRILYGNAQSFEAVNDPDGGFRVRITLPFRPAARRVPHDAAVL